MKVTIHVDLNSCASETPKNEKNSIGLELIEVFFKHQGIKPSYNCCSSNEILKLNSGSNINYSVEVHGEFFHEPIGLIQHFIKNGFIRI